MHPIRIPRLPPWPAMATPEWTPCSCGGATAKINGLSLHTRGDGAWTVESAGRAGDESAARAQAVAIVNAVPGLAAPTPSIAALRNVRAHAARLAFRLSRGHAVTADDLGHFLRFCAAAGVVADPLRDDDDATTPQRGG